MMARKDRGGTETEEQEEKEGENDIVQSMYQKNQLVCNANDKLNTINY